MCRKVAVTQQGEKKLNVKEEDHAVWGCGRAGSESSFVTVTISVRSKRWQRANSRETYNRSHKNTDPFSLSGFKKCGEGHIEWSSDPHILGAVWLSLRLFVYRDVLTVAKGTELAEHWQPSHELHEADLIRGRMAERGLPPEDLPLQPSSDVLSSDRQNSSDENGHADSPDETLSPTSVIYFKEALNSSNLRFGKPESLLPTPLRQYDFRIERIDSKRRSKW